MRKAGQSRGAVAEALGVHLKTISRWSGEHGKLGAAIFVARRRGARLGGARHLSPEQEKALQRMIIEKTPDQLKPAFALWTRRAVCELDRAEVCVADAHSDLRRVSEALGFHPAEPDEVREPKGGAFARRAERSDGNPARRACGQNPAALQRWLEETYPLIATAGPGSWSRDPPGR